jgi:hypothetical protein
MKSEVAVLGIDVPNCQTSNGCGGPKLGRTSVSLVSCDFASSFASTSVPCFRPSITSQVSVHSADDTGQDSNDSILIDAGVSLIRRSQLACCGQRVPRVRVSCQAISPESRDRDGRRLAKLVPAGEAALASSVGLCRRLGFVTCTCTRECT